MATCYVGFYIPKNGGSIDPGIVDLRIAATVKHHGVDVNQPIYSYRKGNRIDVFESAYIAQNCSYYTSDAYILKEWTFDSSTPLVTFGTGFDAIVESYAYNAEKKCATCRMDPDFLKVIGIDTTGLGTIAYLAKALGSNMLWDYYSNPAETNFLSYLPASLRDYGVATGKWVQIADQHDI